MNKRRAISIAVLVVSAVVLAVAIGWQPDTPDDERPSTGLDVVVLGVDGLDWFLLRRYVEEGRMPTFERLLRSSLQTQVVPTRPPIPDAGWVVLGRGRGLGPEESARLEADGDRRLFGITPDVVRAVERAGGSAVSIGWPASWPAAATGPAVAAPYAAAPPSHEQSIAPAFFAEAPGQASSPDLAARIDAAVARSEREAAASFAREIYGGTLPEDPAWARHMAAAAWGYLADRIVLDVAGGFIAEEEPDLALVYLGGLDAVEHRFLAPAMPDYFEGDTSPQEYSRVLPNYYSFIDEALARLIRLVDQDTIIIICSVYGVHPSVDVPSISGSHVNSPPGVFIVRGPDLSPPVTGFQVATADLAPTVLAALGVPIPSEMEGRMLTEVLPSWLLSLFPPDYEPEGIPPQDPPEDVDTGALDALVNSRLGMLLSRPSR
jgi:hypothetical protein